MKNESLFHKKNNFQTLGENVLFSVFFSGNYSTLSDFLKKLLSQSNSAANLLNLAFMKNFRIFPWKPHLLFFWKNPSFASVENFYYFSRSLQQIIYVQLLAVYRKKLIFCFEKAIFYSLKITKFSTFREKLLFQSHSTPTFLPLATFKKNHFFSRKTLCFFLKKPKHCTFWEIWLSQSLSTANFLHLTLSGFERFQYFVSRNPSIFV